MAAHQFLQTYMRELATKNYNQIEITIGKKCDETIFDARIPKKIFDSLKVYFMKDTDSTIQYIESKIYYDLNKELHINKTFQQRVYKNTLYDTLTILHNISAKMSAPLDVKYTFSERKMISIENFRTKFKYAQEVFKKMTSINILNKFYLNFNEFEALDNESYYTISILIKRKTNNKFNELYQLIESYISQIQKIVSLQ
jgi:hypothetical protein